ncbi:rhodanese-like domain-containing protein [Mycoavidus sp. B2-EB]|uniref:rhodanese-like domain-containing protein n=1 Tax=Mycoavidus sp. B2-EB TaxID=2651972 RepID=UPI00162A3B35|nr:rhodanese-like domain-containing protein [Mycoavidus sp. B2-EB]BBO59871.1 hypothetical protein MPB2EB_0998 [Mycoavidus sp. B2-EB]
MSMLEQLYIQAQTRGLEHGLPYAGALTPTEAFEILKMDGVARLIDVRTRAELDWVGRPAVNASQYSHIEWISYPTGAPNMSFINQLSEISSFETPLFLICRSAGRSKFAAAAATQAGFTRAFDILEGFEGDRDSHGHRNTINGWRWQGLPWLGV